MGLVDPDDEEVFEQFLDHNTALIHRLARDGRWTIPWQDVEETEADLAIMLYHAYLNHKPSRGPFRQYFNAIWRQFKAKRVRDSLRAKRSVLVMLLLVDVQSTEADPSWMDMNPEGIGARDQAAVALHGEHEDQTLVPLPFRGLDRYEDLVWHMIQLDYTPQEIVRVLPLNRTRYNALVRAWKDNIMTINAILGVDDK